MSQDANLSAEGETPRVDALLREIKPHSTDPLWKDTERLIALAKSLEIEGRNMRRLLASAPRSAIAPISFDDGIELCKQVVVDFQTRLHIKAGNDQDVSAVIEFMNGILDSIDLLAEAKKLGGLVATESRLTPPDSRGNSNGK